MFFQSPHYQYHFINITISSNLLIDQTKWKKPARFVWSGSINLIVGEWWKFDCRLNNDIKINATLSQARLKNLSIRNPNGKYVKVLEKNVFLISVLKKSDRGRYYCQACGLKKFVGKLFLIGMSFHYYYILVEKVNVISHYTIETTIQFFSHGHS